MEKKPNGLHVPLKDSKYCQLTVSRNNPSHYWKPEFQYPLLRDIPYSFPEAFPDNENAPQNVDFRAVGPLGYELLSKSSPVGNTRIPKCELEKLQQDLEIIHQLAEDPAVPTDRREFYKQFSLPHPATMPEAWRVSGRFKKRLLLIWGIKSRNDAESTFLPQTSISEKWDDSRSRKTLEEVFLRQHLCNWPYTVLATLLALLLLIVLFFGGYFAYNYFSRQNRPNTCRIHPGTHSKDGKCPKCEPGEGNNGQSGVTVPDGKNATGGKTTDPGTKNSDNQSGGSTAGQDDKNKEKQSGTGVTPPIPPQPQKCPVCDTPLNKNGNCPNTCRTHGSHLDGNNQCPKCQQKQVEKYRFKVDTPKLQKSGKANVALAEFSISPLQNMNGKTYTVKNWSINREVKAASGDRFIPEGGLSYSKTYLIGAEVYVDGKEQPVEPFQWNYVDTPAWQIQQTTGSQNFKVICANSSSIQYQVKSWKAEFIAAIGGKQLKFDPVEIDPHGKQASMKWNIGSFTGAYFLNVSVTIEGNFRGTPTNYNHTEQFSFAHSSTTQDLHDLQPRLARRKVYRVDVQMTDGSLANGTACAISSKILLTNYHVGVGDTSGKNRYKVCKIVVLSNKEQTRIYTAKVIASDLNADIAVLQLCNRNGEATNDTLPEWFQQADDNMIRSLYGKDNKRQVFSLGYPAGTVPLGLPAFCAGYTHGVLPNGINAKNVETITHISGIRHGYSGGPLIDYSTGKLLGINWGIAVERVRLGANADMATSMTAIRKLFSDYLDQKF